MSTPAVEALHAFTLARQSGQGEEAAMEAALLAAGSANPLVSRLLHHLRTEATARLARVGVGLDKLRHALGEDRQAVAAELRALYAEIGTPQPATGSGFSHGPPLLSPEDCEARAARFRAALLQWVANPNDSAVSWLQSLTPLFLPVLDHLLRLPSGQDADERVQALERALVAEHRATEEAAVQAKQTILAQLPEAAKRAGLSEEAGCMVLEAVESIQVGPRRQQVSSSVGTEWAGLLAQDSATVWQYMSGGDGAPSYNAALNSLARLEQCAMFGLLTQEGQLLARLKAAAQRTLRYLEQSARGMVEAGDKAAAMRPAYFGSLLVSALDGWSNDAPAMAQAERAVLDAIRDEARTFGAARVRAADKAGLLRAALGSGGEGKEPSALSLENLPDLLGRAAAFVLGWTPEASEISSQESAVRAYEEVAERLEYLSVAASRYIQRSDNNLVFEVRFFLQAVAERIRTEYAQPAGGRELPKPCVRCAATAAALQPLLAPVRNGQALNAKDAARAAAFFEEVPAGEVSTGLLTLLRSIPELAQVGGVPPEIRGAAEQVLWLVQQAVGALRARAEEAEANVQALNGGDGDEAQALRAEREDAVRLVESYAARLKSLSVRDERLAKALAATGALVAQGKLEQAQGSLTTMALLLSGESTEVGFWLSMEEARTIVFGALRAAEQVLAENVVLQAPEVLSSLRKALEGTLVRGTFPAAPPAWKEIADELGALAEWAISVPSEEHSQPWRPGQEQAMQRLGRVSLLLTLLQCRFGEVEAWARGGLARALNAGLEPAEALARLNKSLTGCHMELHLVPVHLPPEPAWPVLAAAVGERLKSLRLTLLGEPQERLAQAGITSEEWQRAEEGRQLPSVEWLVKAAAVLGVAPHRLLEFHGDTA